jgi:hypothetical protein
MKSALAGIGLGLSFSGIVSFLKGAAEGAELARQADAKVLQVAKSMKLFGGETGKVTTRLSEYADQMELTTGQTAEVTKQVQATLLTFKSVGKTADKVGGIFDRATQAAADLAATGFGSAESNAIQLGKALNDPVKGITALARAGVTFTDAEKEKIKALVKSGKLYKAQDIVLKAIESQVGDVAEKTALSSVKIKNAFGQISDQVGEALLPYLDKLSKWLTSPKGQAELKKLAGEITNLVKEAGKLAKWAMENKGVLLGLVGTFAALKVSASVISSYKTLKTIWEGLAKASRLIKPPATGGVGLPQGPVAPGGKLPTVGKNPKGGFRFTPPTSALVVSSAATAAVAVYGSTMVDLYNNDKKKFAKEVKAQVDRAKAYSPNGYYSATDLLIGGSSGVNRGAPLNPGAGGSNMSNVTYKVIIENNNNQKITGADVLTALRKEAAKRGKTVGRLVDLG